MTTDVIRGRYRVRRALGEGAFGEVLLCDDLELSREVALKRLFPSRMTGEARVRFRREARLAAGLAHPHVVQVFDQGEDEEGRPYIVYEFVEGCSLASHLKTRGCPDRDQALRWVEQVGGALSAAHLLGVVHRDLKPDNVMVRDQDLLLADFGLARGADAGTRLTDTGASIGTPLYMAPEMIGGKGAGPSGDQWALGALAYRLLYGRNWRQIRNFQDLYVEGTRAQPVDPSDPRLGRHPDLDPVLRRVLDPLPERRFPDVSAFVDALMGRAPLPPPPDTGRTGLGRPITLLVLGLAGLLLGTLGGLGSVPEAHSLTPLPASPVPEAAAPSSELLRACRDLDQALQSLRIGGEALRGRRTQPGMLRRRLEAFSDPRAPLRLRRVLRSCLEVERLGGSTPRGQEPLLRAGAVLLQIRHQRQSLDEGLLDVSLVDILKEGEDQDRTLAWKDVSPEYEREARALLDEVPGRAGARGSPAFVALLLTLSELAPSEHTRSLMEGALARFPELEPGGALLLTQGLGQLIRAGSVREQLPVPFRQEVLRKLLEHHREALSRDPGPVPLRGLLEVLLTLSRSLRRQEPHPEPAFLELFDATLELVWSHRERDLERVEERLGNAYYELGNSPYFEVGRSPAGLERTALLQHYREEVSPGG